MPVRVSCSTEGLEENWIEVTEVWTRRELTDFMTQKGQPFLDLFAAKVTAVHLVRMDGTVLTDPANVLLGRDELDLRLFRFPVSAVLEATDYLLGLGEANKLLSPDGAGLAAKTTRAPGKTAPAGPG